MFRDKAPDGTTRLTGERPPSPLDSYPVGAVFISVDATSPATLFGGTWARFANGRVLVGVDENDPDFDTVQETRGEKTVALTAANNGPHAHDMGHDHANATAASAGGHGHEITRKAGVGTSTGVAQGNGTAGTSTATTLSDGAHTHVVDIPAHAGNTGSSGSGTAHNNLQPLVTVYIWRRTA